MRNAPDPTLLQTFVTVVEAGSFTGAARRVHRTQSAVSMQIQRLEAALGCRLLERGGQTLRVTSAGEMFYDHARRILADYRTAMGALGGTEPEGELTVGSPEDYVVTFLPEILASFHRAYPRVRTHIVSEASRPLIQHLASGTIDLALLTEGEGPTAGRVVQREPLVWVSSIDHDTHRQDPVPLAIFHSGDVFRRWAVRQLEDAGRHPYIALTCSGFSGIEAAVQSGIAVAVMFEASVRPGMRVLTPSDGFPPLPHAGIVLQESQTGTNELVEHFAARVVRYFRRGGNRH